MDTKMRDWVFNELAPQFLDTSYNVVLGLESQGFLIGPLLAARLGISFVQGQKVKKMIDNVEYTTVSGAEESLKEGQKVLIVDDVLPPSEFYFIA